MPHLLADHGQDLTAHAFKVHGLFDVESGVLVRPGHRLHDVEHGPALFQRPNTFNRLRFLRVTPS